LLTNPFLGDHFDADDPRSENDNSSVTNSGDGPESVASVADRFRTLTVWLIVASIAVAVAMEIVARVRVDAAGSYVFEGVIAAMLTLSRMWWRRHGFERIADVAGTVGLACLGGMAGGAIAMLELRFHLPLADRTLWSLDHRLGFDGLAAVEMLLGQGHWIFEIMAPAYNYTVPLFFACLIALSLMRERIEAWRAAFCFVGTLLTTCLIAMVVPAKGLAMWAPQELLDRLPTMAMRSFWAHFDDFYFGTDPVLRIQAIDAVISYPPLGHGSSSCCSPRFPEAATISSTSSPALSSLEPGLRCPAGSRLMTGFEGSERRSIERQSVRTSATHCCFESHRESNRSGKFSA
jgi:hypothetical protein